MNERAQLINNRRRLRNLKIDAEADELGYIENGKLHHGQENLRKIFHRNGGSNYEYASSLYTTNNIDGSYKMPLVPYAQNLNLKINRERNFARSGLQVTQDAYNFLPQNNLTNNGDMLLEQPNLVRQPIRVTELMSNYDDPFTIPPSLLFAAGCTDIVIENIDIKNPLSKLTSTRFGTHRSEGLKTRVAQYKYACVQMFNYNPNIFNDPYLIVNKYEISDYDRYINTYIKYYERKTGIHVYPTIFHRVIQPLEDQLRYDQALISDEIIGQIVEPIEQIIQEGQYTRLDALVTLALLPNVFLNSRYAERLFTIVHTLCESAKNPPKPVSLTTMMKNNPFITVMQGIGYSYMMDPNGNKVENPDFLKGHTTMVPFDAIVAEMYGKGKFGSKAPGVEVVKAGGLKSVKIKVKEEEKGDLKEEKEEKDEKDVAVEDGEPVKKKKLNIAKPPVPAPRRGENVNIYEPERVKVIKKRKIKFPVGADKPVDIPIGVDEPLKAPIRAKNKVPIKVPKKAPVELEEKESYIFAEEEEVAEEESITISCILDNSLGIYFDEKEPSEIVRFVNDEYVKNDRLGDDQYIEVTNDMLMDTTSKARLIARLYVCLEIDTPKFISSDTSFVFTTADYVLLDRALNEAGIEYHTNEFRMCFQLWLESIDPVHHEHILRIFQEDKLIPVLTFEADNQILGGKAPIEVKVNSGEELVQVTEAVEEGSLAVLKLINNPLLDPVRVVEKNIEKVKKGDKIPVEVPKKIEVENKEEDLISVDIDSKENLVDDKELYLIELGVKVQELRKKNFLLEKQYAVTKDKLNALGVKTNEYEQANEQLKSQLEEKTRLLSQVDLSNEKAVEVMGGQSELIDRMEIDIQNANEEIVKRDSALKNAKEEIAKMGGIISNKDQQRAALESEIQNLMQRIENNQQMYEQEKARYTQQKQLYENLKAETAKTQAMLNDAMAFRELYNINKDVSLKSVYDTLNAQLATFRQREQDLVNEGVVLENKYNEAVNEKNELSKSLLDERNINVVRKQQVANISQTLARFQNTLVQNGGPLSLRLAKLLTLFTSLAEDPATFNDATLQDVSEFHNYVWAAANKLEVENEVLKKTLTENRNKAIADQEFLRKEHETKYENLKAQARDDFKHLDDWWTTQFNTMNEKYQNLTGELKAKEDALATAYAMGEKGNAYISGLLSDIELLRVQTSSQHLTIQNAWMQHKQALEEAVQLKNTTSNLQNKLVSTEKQLQNKELEQKSLIDTNQQLQEANRSNEIARQKRQETYKRKAEEEEEQKEEEEVTGSVDEPEKKVEEKVEPPKNMNIETNVQQETGMKRKLRYRDSEDETAPAVKDKKLSLLGLEILMDLNALDVPSDKVEENRDQKNAVNNSKGIVNGSLLKEETKEDSLNDIGNPPRTETVEKGINQAVKELPKNGTSKEKTGPLQFMRELGANGEKINLDRRPSVDQRYEEDLKNKLAAERERKKKQAETEKKFREEHPEVAAMIDETADLLFPN